MDFDSVGNQLVEHGSRGIRLFLLNRFDDPAPAKIIVRLKCDTGIDTLDGSIEASIARTLEDMAVGNGLALVVTTMAQKDRQISERRVGRLLGREQGPFISLEQHRVTDDWYSATLTIGENEDRYGPLYFVNECPQQPPAPADSPRAPEPAENKPAENKSAEYSAKPDQPWYRRLFS